ARCASPRLSPPPLDQTFTFWAPLSPQAEFERVFELPPGMLLVADANGEELRRYWDWQFPEGADGYWSGSEEQLAGELRDLLIDATRIRLRADVPVGAYLSGGLDSSVLTSLIHKHTQTP